MPRWKAILFDLDGTLLDNNMEVFAKRFLERLVARLGHLLPAEELIERALGSTRAMATHDGSRTNEEVFAAVFHPLGDCPRAEGERLLAAFYESDFGDLRRYTARRPEARAVVERAIALGCDVVLATNPVFPETAIRQRMSWAGVDDLPFRWVTTYENSRSAKPNLRYYAEILERIGKSGSECLMVGDEAGDMAATELGCATYLVPSATTKLAAGARAPDFCGPLADVMRLLDDRPA